MTWLPPAFSISKFQGGYRPSSSFSDLLESETADAQNCLYTVGGKLVQVPGSNRLYNRRLTSTSGTAGRPITGHYFFDKLGVTQGYHIAGAGNSLYNYTSSTANAIRTGLVDNSQTYWAFVQILDPRNIADDMVLMTNGVDPIQIWNGTGTASLLSSLTSATSVPICKLLLQHDNYVYAANIVDSSNADNPVKVMRTEIGSDLAPNPHRFTSSFFVGGSDKGGELLGQELLSEQIIYYTRTKIWRFTPALGDTRALEPLEDDIGLYAPLSLVSTEKAHIFLSEKGVYLFDGSNPRKISKEIDDLLLKDTNQAQLKYAKGTFDQGNNQYKLWIPGQGQDTNDTTVVYDLTLGIWQPPVKGRRANFVSSFYDSNNRTRVLYGDYFGYLYEEGVGKNQGLQDSYNGIVTSANLSTLYQASANFSTAGDGLSGFYVRLYEGTGVDQERVITTNDTATLNITPDWTVPPDSTSKFAIAPIESYWRSKDYDMGAHDIVKLFRTVRTRTKELGNINLDMHYIVDFATLPRATKKQILQLSGGWCWGISKWGQSRWGGKAVMKSKISLRNTTSQKLQGTHMALRFSNVRANEDWELSGYDIEVKGVGKR